MILIAFISVQAEVSSKQAEVLDRMVFTISIDDAHDCDLIIEALL
jgi:3-hydroxyacyl-CoA dehydrogenase